MGVRLLKFPLAIFSSISSKLATVFIYPKNNPEISRMQIRFTKHAEDMLRERNIDRTLVESAVQNPDWKKDADNELWYAFKRVGTKVLRTVVKGKEKPYTVITTYYNKRLKK